MTVTTTHRLMPLRLAGEAWHFYRRTFTPLAELAAQAHMMNMDDFFEMTHDPRIVKHVTGAGEGITGLAVSTNDLEAWPLISPPYFAKNWPDEYERRAIWYVGFVCTDQRTRGVFEALLDSLSAPVRAVGGMAFMDYCQLNEDRGIPQASGAYAMKHDPRAALRRHDVQATWSISYPPLPEGDE